MKILIFLILILVGCNSCDERKSSHELNFDKNLLTNQENNDSILKDSTIAKNIVSYDVIDSIPNMISNKKTLFTGIIKRDEKSDIRTGIYLTKIRKGEYKYDYSKQVNWKTVDSKSGHLVLAKPFEILNYFEDTSQVYILRDTIDNLNVILSLDNAIVMENDSMISALMYRK